jgi:hypothetical protein
MDACMKKGGMTGVMTGDPIREAEGEKTMTQSSLCLAEQ